MAVRLFIFEGSREIQFLLNVLCVVFNSRKAIAVAVIGLLSFCFFRQDFSYDHNYLKSAFCSCILN